MRISETGLYNVTAYHGGKHDLHRKMFFSSDEHFASSYGPVEKYQINVMNFVDSLDPDLIQDYLPLYDHYDNREITSIEEYMELSQDTWEMIEERADEIIANTGADGIIIYEGGVKNYLVYNIDVVSKVRPILEKVNLRASKVIDLRDPKVKKPLENMHLVLTRDGGVMIYYYSDGNKIRWHSEKSENIYDTISNAMDKTLQDDINGIRFSRNGGILIDKSRSNRMWSGDKNQYSIDIKPVVERLLDTGLISLRTPIYIGNWARRDDDGELIGTASRVIKAAHIPNKLVLYHGTSNARLSEIMKNGIAPLGKEARVWNRDTAKDMPDHRHDSIYLTASMGQAEYYAKKATNVDRKRLSFRYRLDAKDKISQLERQKSSASDTEIATIQEKIDQLNTALVLLDRMNRAVDKAEPVVLKIELNRRDYKYLMADDDYINKQKSAGQTVDPTDWRNSLSDFGQVAYRGTIPPDRITRA